MIDAPIRTLRSRRLTTELVGALLLVVPVLMAPPGAANADPRFSDGWILVRLGASVEAVAGGSIPLITGRTALDELILDTGVNRIEPVFRASGPPIRYRESAIRHGLDRTYRFHVPQGSNILALVEAFAGLPEVEWAEPDYTARPGIIVPDDPLFPDQWGLKQPSNIPTLTPNRCIRLPIPSILSMAARI